LLPFVLLEIMFSSGQKVAMTSHLLMNVFLSYLCCDWCTCT